MSAHEVQCAYCARKRCFFGDLSQAPDFCPTSNYPEVLASAKTKLDQSENQKMAQDVARTWKGGYGKLTRVEETVLYAKLRGYKKLGLAFCVGLSKEAVLMTNLLLNEGFDVASVCCMCGGLSCDDVNLPQEDKIELPVGTLKAMAETSADVELALSTRQPMCNPIGQAAILEAEGCEFNILFGLCVGDDTLF
ncbi:MAG: DUF1847 domain-containing protein, partial [Pseudomonadota bacterium]